MKCKYGWTHFLKLVTLDICRSKNAERNTYERKANPRKAQHISSVTSYIYKPSSPLISSFLPVSLPLVSLCLTPKPIPLSSLSSENVPKMSDLFWDTHSLNLPPLHNLSPNIQSPLMSLYPQKSPGSLCAMTCQ